MNITTEGAPVADNDTSSTTPKRGRGRPRKTPPVEGLYKPAPPQRRKNARNVRPVDAVTSRKATQPVDAPEPEEIDGLMMHAALSTVTGAPRWSHPLFPTERKTQAEMRAYDKADHEYGQPSILRLQRKNEDGTLVQVPDELNPTTTTASSIVKKYGGGTYWCKAFAVRVVEGDTLQHQCTRAVWLTLPGPPKAIAGAEDDEPEEEETEEEEGDEEEEDTSRRRRGMDPLMAQIEIARIGLETRKLEMDAAEKRAEKERIAERERIREERHDNDARLASERAREREFMTQMMQMRDAPTRAAAPPPNGLVDALNVALAKIVTDKLTGEGAAAGAGSTVAAIREVAEPLVQQAGAAAVAFFNSRAAEAQARAAEAEAKTYEDEPEETGDNNDEEEVEEDDDDATPPTGVPAPAPLNGAGAKAAAP